VKGTPLHDPQITVRIALKWTMSIVGVNRNAIVHQYDLDSTICDIIIRKNEINNVFIEKEKLPVTSEELIEG
jgi:hypothetical protein